MERIKRSKQLSEFVNHAHEVFVATSFACGGLAYRANTIIKKQNPNPSNRIFVGENEPGKGPIAGVMNSRKLLKESRPDGIFPDALRKSALVSLYSEWNGYYRAAIADELAMKTEDVLSDTIGDLRLIRNMIVHKRSIADSTLYRLKVLKWSLAKGRKFNITGKIYEEFMYELNSEFGIK